MTSRAPPLIRSAVPDVAGQGENCEGRTRAYHRWPVVPRGFFAFLVQQAERLALFPRCTIDKTVAVRATVTDAGRRATCGFGTPLDARKRHDGVCRERG